MADCVPFIQWLNANTACNAKNNPLSVKGFGYVPTGRRAMRGLGFSISASVTPASIAQAVQSGQLVQTAAAPAAPPVISQPSLNTTPVYDPSDPCYIASQTPCSAGTGCPALCPQGYHSISLLTAPGRPAQCVCGKDKAAPSPIPTPADNTPAYVPPVQATATGGFSHWGLLAALGVGAGALYLVMRKKS